METSTLLNIHKFTFLYFIFDWVKKVLTTLYWAWHEHFPAWLTHNKLKNSLIYKITLYNNQIFSRVTSYSGFLLPLIVGISWSVSFAGSAMSLYLSPRCFSRYGPQLEAGLQHIMIRWNATTKSCVRI